MDIADDKWADDTYDVTIPWQYWLSRFCLLTRNDFRRIIVIGTDYRGATARSSSGVVLLTARSSLGLMLLQVAPWAY